MRTDGDLAVFLLLRGGRRERLQPRTDAGDRSGVFGSAALRLASDGSPAAADGIQDRPEAGASSDAQNGALCGLLRAEDVCAASLTSDLSVPATGRRDRAAEPRLVCRHHVHPDASGLLVPGGDHGLGDAGGAVLAVEQHDASGLLRGGPPGGAVALREAGDLQHPTRGASSPAASSRAP